MSKRDEIMDHFGVFCCFYAAKNAKLSIRKLFLRALPRSALRCDVATLRPRTGALDQVIHLEGAEESEVLNGPVSMPPRVCNGTSGRTHAEHW